MHIALAKDGDDKMVKVSVEKLQETLHEVRQTIIEVTLIASIISLIAGVCLVGIALWIYFKKVKGQEKPSKLLAIGWILLLIIGLLLILNGISGLIVLALAPSLVRSFFGIGEIRNPYFC